MAFYCSIWCCFYATILVHLPWIYGVPLGVKNGYE